MPAKIENDPDALLAVALIMDDQGIVHHDLIAHAPGELAAVTAILARAYQDAVARTGRHPAELHVRHRAVAELLRSELVFPRPRIYDTELPGIDHAAHSLAQRFGGPASVPASMPETWAGWGLPRAAVAELFHAAAEYYQAAPWGILNDRQPVQIMLPTGRRWTACVMGNGGVLRGLALYEDPQDYFLQITAEPRGRTATPVHPVLSLSFGSSAELERRMHREILAAGWEVAGPKAFPSLVVLATPGGGVSRGQAGDLTAALRMVPRFVAAHRSELAESVPAQPVHWRDKTSNISLAYFGMGIIGPGLAPASALPEGISSVELEEILQGDWLTSGGLRLNPDLTLGDVGGSIFFRNARIMLETIRDDGPAAATATGNLARAFVATMLDRMEWEAGYVERVRWANRTVNELDVFPLHVVRLVLVEAGLLRRRRGFHLTSDAQRLLADDSAGALYLQLFLAFFRRLNLAYLDGGSAHPGLQETIALAFRRIQTQANKWTDPDTLATRAWPESALDRPDAFERIDPDHWVLRLAEARLFYPMFDFGLLERRLLQKASFGVRHYRIRKTALYDRFIRFPGLDSSARDG